LKLLNPTRGFVGSVGIGPTGRLNPLMTLLNVT